MVIKSHASLSKDDDVSGNGEGVLPPTPPHLFYFPTG